MTPSVLMVSIFKLYHKNYFLQTLHSKVSFWQFIKLVWRDFIVFVLAS